MSTNEWRETVRDIFDLLITVGAKTSTEITILRMIEASHTEFFSGPVNGTVEDASSPDTAP